MSDMAMKYGMQKRGRKCMAHGTMDCMACGGEPMAEGGEVEGVNKQARHPNEHGVSEAGEYVRGGDKARAKMEHHKVLKEMKTNNKYYGPDARKNLAEGGEVEGDDDLVGRIMKKRKGDPVADFESADFDELDKEPPPHPSSETRGDELGDEELDENDSDLIRRIMRSRAKKDRLPRPA